MFRRRLALSCLLFGAAHIGSTGCKKELEISEPIDASKVVRAQFDPTHPVPVLRLVPSPTGIAQNPTTGDLLPDRVAPQTCELPSSKQCLQFVSGGWPTSTPITLFFSGPIDEGTIEEGIILLEEGVAAPVEYTAVMSERPAPPAACAEQFMYDATAIPPGVQVVLSPMGGMKPGTRYFVVVKNTVRDGMGKAIEPTALFHLLNVDDTMSPDTQPVTADGRLNDPLLRSNVTTLVASRLFPNTPISMLDDTQRMQLEAAIMASGMDLFGLFRFFNGAVDGVRAFAPAVVDSRKDIVFVNTWTTAPVAMASAGPVLDFNPRKSKVPFPNTQLLTRTATPSDPVRGGIRPALPVPPGVGQTQSLLRAINTTLNGFSTTSSITMTASAHVDIMSIDPTPNTPCFADECAIVMYPMNDMDEVPAGTPGVPLLVDVIQGVDSVTGTDSSTISIAPGLPLLQNTEYVIGVKRGITSMDGAMLRSEQAFEFLKTPTPLIDNAGVVAETILGGTGQVPFRALLECSGLQDPAVGRLLTAQEVAVTAGTLEQPEVSCTVPTDCLSLTCSPRDPMFPDDKVCVGLRHQAWQPAFAALEMGPATPRTDVLMAFTYKTQDITIDLDFIKGEALDPPVCTPQDPCWDLYFLGQGQPRVVDTGFVVRGQAGLVNLFQVIPQLCVPACLSGVMEPAIPRADCATFDGNGNITGIHPDLPANQICGLAQDLVTGNLAEAHLYLIKGFTVTSGNPFAGAGTFTQETVVQPQIVDLQMWVVTGTNTPAAAGRPVAVFQHGLGQRKESGFYIANVLAGNRSVEDPSGWATVLIDLPFHGSRASDISNNDTGAPCPNVDPNTVQCVDPDGNGPQPIACVDAMGMPPCDGRQDASATGFLSPNLFATRDNFRQSTIDQLTLLRTLRIEGAPGGAFEGVLDGSRVGYIGQSLGGITGGNLASYLRPDEISNMVLNVPGGGLVNNILLKTIPRISAPLYLALSANPAVCRLVDPNNPSLGCQDEPGFRRFRIIAQWILDPGDPLANSIGVTETLYPGRTPLSAREIMMQLSVPDLVVSNQAGFALGNAIFERATPGDLLSQPTDPNFHTYDFTSDPVSAGPPQAPSGCHGFILGPFCGTCNNGDPTQMFVSKVCNTVGAQIQAGRFLATGQSISNADAQMFFQIQSNLPCNACD